MTKEGKEFDKCPIRIFILFCVLIISLAFARLSLADAASPSNVDKAPTRQIPQTQAVPVQALPDLYCILKVTAIRTRDQCGTLTTGWPLIVNQGASLYEVTSGDLVWCGLQIFKIFSFEWEVTIGNKGIVDTSGSPVNVVTILTTNNSTSTLGSGVFPLIPKGGSIPAFKYTRYSSPLPAGAINVTTTITYNGQEIAKNNNTCTHQFTFHK